MNIHHFLCSENSYKKKNDDKTPGKVSDSNDDPEPARTAASKRKTQIQSKNLNKADWMLNGSDPAQQQENIAVAALDQNIINNRPSHRRGKTGIAKALQYGEVADHSSSNHSGSKSSDTVPLYR